MNNRDPIDREPGPERGSVEYGISFENMELMRLSYVEAVPAPQSEHSPLDLVASG